MKLPVLLFVLSGLVCVFGYLVPAWSDVLLASGPAALASGWLVWRAWRRPDWIIVDGSNVMYWKDNTPKVEPLLDVIHLLRSQGLSVVVFFDANAGHLLAGRYLHHDAFAKLLKHPEKHIMVVPKGTPADPYILKAAQGYRARIVTNDQFRDWAEEYPDVGNAGFLIKGEYRSGQLSLDLA
jgi:hypothetical protein